MSVSRCDHALDVMFRINAVGCCVHIIYRSRTDLEVRAVCNTIWSINFARPTRKKQHQRRSLCQSKEMMLMRVCYLLILLGIAHAHQSGAGSCDGGKPVVAGPHLEFGIGSSQSSRVGGSGTLQEGFTSLHLAGIKAEADRKLTVPVGSDLAWTLVAGRFPIRGFLLRMEAPDGVETVAAITCGVNQTLASACMAPVVGCTHVEKSDKWQVNGSLRLDEIAEGVKLDITVVYQNNMELNDIDKTLASLYAYSQFTVDFVEDDSVTEPPGSGNPFLAFLAVIKEIIELIVSIFT